MARSSYIYILETDTNPLIAAFTVKWEAFQHWERHLDKNQNVKLYRVPDGYSGDPVYIDLE